MPAFFADCRLYFGATGLVTILLTAAIHRWPKAFAGLERNEVLNGLLLFGLVLLPLLYLELASPSTRAMNKTSIFIPDAERGWKYKPGMSGEWGGVPVRINSQGYRGPVIPYAKPAGQVRILFLGDSITFGYRIERDQDTIPAQVEANLQNHTGRPITAINAGVGGYSPWQEWIQLQSEGLRYDPDWILLSFVLNDVTEKIRLVQFGGKDRGYQLSQNINGMLDHSNFYFFLTRKLLPTLVLGIQTRQGAVEKELQFGQSLVLDADSPQIQALWDITLANMEKIITLCQRENKKIGLILFPYTFQIVNADTMNQPQEVVIAFAAKHGVPVLDLLPLYAEKFTAEPILMDDLFFDDNHPTAAGAQAAAEWIAAWLEPQLD
ncbi:MAG: SGNH/GDSL hydrolase family protein [bacterium]|jgi:lysophospholipase L1-like esterase|nr:SGNH/GDSL hydrolase family protein [bacterium]